MLTVARVLAIWSGSLWASMGCLGIYLGATRTVRTVHEPTYNEHDVWIGLFMFAFGLTVAIANARRSA